MIDAQKGGQMNAGIFIGSDKKRFNRLAEFYERRIATLINIPYAGLTPLNSILGELFATGKMPRHNMILLRLTQQISIKPHYLRGKTVEYNYRFLKKLYRVKVGKSDGPKIFRLNLELKNMVFTWQENFLPHSKPILLPDLAMWADLNAQKFKKAVGIAVKKTSRRGVFKIGGHHINLSVRHQKKIVLVFFDKGQLFIYDLNGRQIKPISR